MRIYNEEWRKNSIPAKSPLSPSSSTSSSCRGITSVANGDISPSPASGELAESMQFAGSTVSINRVPISVAFNKTNRPNINMYKFIKSKGKQITKENYTVNGNSYYTDSQYCEPRLPRYVTGSKQFYRKRLSAIDKIQEELREMKQRENELRCQRVRTIGLSYPNLSSMCDEDFVSDDQTIESSEENRDSFHSSRCSSSNPDLSIPTHDTARDSVHVEIPSNKEELNIGGPRKKIPLIAMWEERIQGVSEKK